MKYIFLAVCVAFSCASSAQDGPIKVHLKTGETIPTDYVYLKNGSLSKAYAMIHSRDGERITIDKIDYIDGTDQYGIYHYYKGMKFSGAQIWGERSYTSDHIEIYYTNINYIGGGGNIIYKSKYYRYSKDHGPLQKLSYRNAKRDLSDCPASMPYLKKANGLRLIQDVLYVGGAAFYRFITLVVHILPPCLTHTM